MSRSAETRELDRAVQETAALLDALFRSAPVGLGFWDRDLRFVRVNDALARINERPAEDHVGRTLREVVPQFADELEALAQRVLDTGESVIELEMVGGTPNDPDALRYWASSYYPVVGADGERIGVGAVVEETTDRRRAEQRTDLQHDVTRTLAEEDSADAAIARVLETICVGVGWDVGCYWSTDPDEPRITWSQPAARLDGFVALTERANLAPAMLPGRVAQSGASEWLEDVEPESLLRAPVALAEGLRSGVAFPVLIEGVVVGVLELFSTLRRPRDEQLMASLEALGGQLGQFLRRKRVEEERAHLLQRERQARAEAEAAATTLRKLERVADAVVQHPSLQDLLDALLQRIVEVLDADTAAILLLADDDCLYVRATVGFGAEIGHAVAVPVGQGMAGRVAATREPLLVPDLAQIELVSPVLRERGINSLVAIPLVVEDQVIGVVHAASIAFAQFVDEDARLLELIADRIALAINQAALHEAERASQERLQFLGEASALLASSLDVEATVTRVAQLAVPHFADRCSIDLFERDAVLTPRAEDDSAMVIPLVVRDLTVGALTFAWTEPGRRYGEADHAFARELAARVAVAVDNARLFREAEHRRERLAFLAEASALLGSSLDVERTLEQLGALVEGRVAERCTIELTGDGNADPDEDAHVEGNRVALPLRARGRVFGTMTLVTAEPFDAGDVEFALDLARRAAIAIDNAQLYSAAAERAQAARVLASVGDGVFLVDRAGYVRTWNRTAASATGLPASEVVDRLAAEVIPGWSAIATRIVVTAAGSSAPRPESLPLDLGDRELWLSIHGVAVPDGVVYAFRDLTEERALEQMRTEFVSTVSHELRTPLAAIYGAAMTLRRSDVELDEDQRARLLDVVSGEADRLARTVNDILWASRLDTDSLHVSIQNCDPLELVHEVVRAQEAHLDQAHQLVLDVDDALPHVSGDPDKVGRVLINLVDNAVKYSPDGGNVHVAVKPVGAHVRFSITDDGLGIPPSEQRRVFEKFYRLDPQMNRGVGGTGLGLYICRELVRRMDGRIWVDSRGAGRGSTFHVELPAATY